MTILQKKVKYLKSKRIFWYENEAHFPKKKLAIQNIQIVLNIIFLNKRI